MTLLFAALALGLTLYGQPAQTQPAADPEEAEREHFRRVVAEAGSSPSDYARALEYHLEKFPDSPQRVLIERSIVQAAMEARDDRRILKYGERVLTREPENFNLLERFTRALLGSDDAGASKRALEYARRYAGAMERLGAAQGAGPRAHLKDDVDARLGKALVYQARATGNLGQFEPAAELARRSYDVYPTAEAAREAGRWLVRLGRHGEAVRAYADAFVIDDMERTEEQRAADRARMKEAYLKLYDSEAGLGDLVLEAYDRTSALLKAHRESLRKLDPNFDVEDPLEFTLTGLRGGSLKLASLKGKVVVLDFWATWCGPCRAQQPLYEEVQEKYNGRDDVVFLNISTDENREVVAPFLERNKWKKTVYFDDGLQRLLNVTSIPTTVVFDKQGRVGSRMNGYIPHRFVDMLAERIDQMLAER